MRRQQELAKRYQTMHLSTDRLTIHRSYGWALHDPLHMLSGSRLHCISRGRESTNAMKPARHRPARSRKLRSPRRPLKKLCPSRRRRLADAASTPSRSGSWMRMHGAASEDDDDDGPQPGLMDCCLCFQLLTLSDSYPVVLSFVNEGEGVEVALQ